MTHFQLYLVLLIMILVLGILFAFRAYIGKVKLQHLRNMQQLHLAIGKHKVQISIRNKSLDNYNFLSYNISEALVIQPNIKIDSRKLKPQ